MNLKLITNLNPILYQIHNYVCGIYTSILWRARTNIKYYTTLSSLSKFVSSPLVVASKKLQMVNTSNEYQEDGLQTFIHIEIWKNLPVIQRYAGYTSCMQNNSDYETL